MVTYGFYNSIDHDRRYDAVQMSSIFDGIIRDGIFMSIGDCFRVNENTEAGDMSVLIGKGRAWFDHTWTLNDAPLMLQVPQSEIILNRIDAVILEVNAEPSVRANEIKIISGTPATNPTRPALIKTEYVHQYALAYIYVGERVTSIRQANITNMIGTSDTPFITGILETINIDMLVAQWGDQWKQFYEIQTGDMIETSETWKTQWSEWYDQYTGEMIETGKYWKEKWENWFYMYVNSNSNDIAQWKYLTNAAFMEWWDNLKLVLEPDVAGNMANKIAEQEARIKVLEQFRKDLIYDHAIYEPLQGDGYAVRTTLTDQNEDIIKDADLDNIWGMDYNIEDLITSDGTPLELRLLVEVTI